MAGVGEAGLCGHRDPRLDLLRVAGAFMVVVLHVSAEAVLSVRPDYPGWWLANVANAGSRWGDAIFLMCGGAMLLLRDSVSAPWAFARARVSRLLPALLFWSVFYLWWRQWMWGDLPWTVLASELVRGVPFYHLWFLYMLIGMYLFAPVLRGVVTACEPRLQYYLLAVCAAVTVVEAATRTLLGGSHASFLALFPLFIVYFLGGYLVYRDRPRLSIRLLGAVAIGCVAVMAVGVALLHGVLGERVFALMYSNRGVPAMVLTFCLFVAGLSLSPQHPLLQRWHAVGGRSMAAVVLGIYVIHPFWIGMLAKWGWGVRELDPLWAVPVLSLVVFGLSVLTASAMAWVPGLRRVVR